MGNYDLLPSAGHFAEQTDCYRLKRHVKSCTNYICRPTTIALVTAPFPACGRSCHAYHGTSGDSGDLSRDSGTGVAAANQKVEATSATLAATATLNFR